MTWITQEELKRYEQVNALPEVRGHMISNASEEEACRILLVYSRFDVTSKEAAIQFLNSQGVQCQFETMCVDSAISDFGGLGEVKRVIQGCQKIVILAGNQSLRSRWLVWFLAYFEAFKVKLNIALLPIADESHIWLGDTQRPELGFIRFYSRIGKFVQGIWCVQLPTRDAEQMKLSTWMKKVQSESMLRTSAMQPARL